MSLCTLCCPWNLPLERKAQHVVGAGTVPMRYEEWISYHLHVVLHQAGKYSGQMDEIIAAIHNEETHHEARQLKEVTNV